MYFHDFVFLYVGLPKALSATLQEVTDHFAKVKETIQTLEECHTKAKSIQEDILIIQSMTKYLPMKEIEEIIEKSEVKVDNVRRLHKLIGDLENQPGFMREEDLKNLFEQIKALKVEMSIE
jgi:hypothetical protein